MKETIYKHKEEAENEIMATLDKFYAETGLVPVEVTFRYIDIAEMGGDPHQVMLNRLKLVAKT